MRILIDGILYDSNKTPVLLVFDEKEKEIFGGLNKFVSAPKSSTIEERQELLDTDI